MENNTWLGSQLTFSWLLMRLGTFSNVCWPFRFLLRACVHLVTQSCPTLCNPMDCSLSGSSDRGNSQGKNTRVGCLTSRQSSQRRDQTQVSRIAGRFFTSWATREAPGFFSQQTPIHTIYPFIYLVLFLYFLIHGSYIFIFVTNIFSPFFGKGWLDFSTFYTVLYERQKFLVLYKQTLIFSLIFSASWLNKFFSLFHFQKDTLLSFLLNALKFCLSHISL